MTEKTPPLPGQVYEIIPNIEAYKPEDELHNTERVPTLDPENATVTTSRVAGKDGVHKVILDLDLPAKLVPSTTPGHFHLYVDHELDWDRYARLLEALGDAGLLEPGYVGASLARGHTAARLPWVKKGAPQ